MIKHSIHSLLTLCLFHFSCSFCYSQEQTDSLKKKEKNFSFAIYGGGAYPFGNYGSKMKVLNLSNTPSEDNQRVSFPSSSEKGVTTGNAGIYFEFRLIENAFLNI